MDSQTISAHARALVPIESWCFNSPELLTQGKSVDLGLLAEALIYYDQVLFNVADQPQFAAVLEWFLRQNCFSDLLKLFQDGTLYVYEYSFLPASVYDEKNDQYFLYNLEDEEQQKPNSFERRFLYHSAVQNLIIKGRHRNQLYRVLRDRVIEAKAREFEDAIHVSRKDFGDVYRNSLIVQSFIDELFRFRGLEPPPEIGVQIKSDGPKQTATFNIDFKVISELAGESLNWHSGSPLVGGAAANRLLLSASRLNSDLFLPRPMSVLVGDKLYESSKAANKTKETIESLKEKVEFPDIRFLVNGGKLGVKDILFLRKKAKRFRTWLQTGAERDRDAIIAYHHEVAKETNLTKYGRKALSLFGFIGGGALGGGLGASLAGPSGAALGGAAGGAFSYLLDVGSKLGQEWKPVIFGEWLKERIIKIDKAKF